MSASAPGPHSRWSMSPADDSASRPEPGSRRRRRVRVAPRRPPRPRSRPAGVAALAGAPDVADTVWAAAVAALLLVLLARWRRKLAVGRIGVDAIALLAMAGALVLGQYLAGAVIALMLSGGDALEAAPPAARGGSSARSCAGLRRRHTDAMAARSRRSPVEALGVATRRGAERRDRSRRRHGRLGRGGARRVALTGEALPVRCRRGEPVRSGTANAGPPFDLRADRPAAESAYAALVRLVRAAEAERAPFVRLADRYAAVLLPLTLVLAGAAWALSGRPRASARGAGGRHARARSSSPRRSPSSAASPAPRDAASSSRAAPRSSSSAAREPSCSTRPGR